MSSGPAPSTSFHSSKARSEKFEIALAMDALIDRRIEAPRRADAGARLPRTFQKRARPLAATSG